MRTLKSFDTMIKSHKFTDFSYKDLREQYVALVSNFKYLASLMYKNKL